MDNCDLKDMMLIKNRRKCLEVNIDVVEKIDSVMILTFGWHY